MRRPLSVAALPVAPPTRDGFPDLRDALGALGMPGRRFAAERIAFVVLRNN